MRWVAFFSQTGSEIVEISRRLNKVPDLIVTNNRPAHLRKFHPEILKLSPALAITPNKPDVVDYLQRLRHTTGDPNQTLVTLHGWLRIVPKEVTDLYENVFNGHPGLISRYPELKGKDPQMKAWEMDLDTSGCVIHEVTEELDDGFIISEKEIPIRNLTLDQLFENLHKTSIDLWVDFLSEKLSK
jgi:folate-dependent phosphoribosylglycinamide formyltransferase PurN